MKYLYQLIGELQNDKRTLSMRVDELEQQLYELYQIQSEEASTHELLSIEEAEEKRKIEMENASKVPDLIQVTRSERHPKPEKTTFWDFLLRR
jgi:hypothetical protein